LEALRKRETILVVVRSGGTSPRKKENQKKVQVQTIAVCHLRQKRNEMADEAGVHAYVIFSDRTLTEMVPITRNG